MKRLTLLLLTFLFVGGIVNAQMVSGTITDTDGEVLIGANVIEKGTVNGTITDFDGNYSLELSGVSTTLMVSYTGYGSMEIDAAGQSTLDITMSEGEILSEVVVLGYRNSTKPKSAVAQQTVSASTISARPNASFVQTLQGQVSGLRISSSSGQPGGDSQINLRGVSSVNGNTEPLFIMDGTPIDEDNFRSLNPNEIESVSVLKDAGATAIYGNRGANGVIVITTKTGGGFNKGLKFGYTATVGQASLQDNKYELMTAQEQLRLEQQVGSGRGAGITEDSIGRVTGTDWLDVFFVKPTTITHNFSITNSSENFNSFTNFGYTDQEGILVDSGLKRYNFRTNLNGKSNNGKLNYGTRVSLNYSNNNEPNSVGSSAINRNYILGALQSVPYIALDEYSNGAGLLSPLSFANTPLFLYDRLQTYTRYENEIKAIASLNASYEIVDGLRISSTLGSDFTDQNLVRAEGPTSFNALLFAGGAATPGFQSQSNTRVFSYNWLNSLNYDLAINDLHSVSAGVYTEYFRAYYDFFSFQNEGLDPRTFSPGDGSGFVDDNGQDDFYSNDVNAERLRAGLFSVFGSLAYDYDSKYGIDLTMRRDASYRFAASNRWGTFYSIAGRWNIDQESFMQDSPFDMLKLRASYGKTGNQRIVDNTGFLSYFGAADLTQNFFGTGSGYGGANSLFLSQIGNLDLRWETVTQSNVGLDFELLRSRLRGSVDYYIKTTTDLFQDKPVSAINATNNLRANTGSLMNSGIDFNINYDLIKSSNGFNLDVFFNTNFNKQEFIDIPTPDGSIQDGDFINREGSIIDEYYVYRYVGVNPANGNLLFLDADDNETENPSPDTDRVFTGQNYFPDYQGGMGFNAGFKGFFLTAQFNYVAGVWRRDFDLAGFQDPTSIGQFRSTRDLLRAWDTEGQITDIPSLSATNLALDSSSDRYLFKSDYVRLRYVEFGYNLPKSLTEKVNLSSARIFANAENLYTWSSWRGFDADVQDNASRGYPNPRIISGGIEIEF